MSPFDHKPFGRRGRIGRDEELEAALRDSLAANARQAPDPDAVTARILAAADQPPATGSATRGPWRTWGLPLVAAASVAAIVSGAFAISHYHPESNGAPAVDSMAPTPLASVPSTLPTPTRDPTTPSSSPAQPSSSTSSPADTSTLHNVHVLDLTFTGENDGWGLASADCIGGSGTCTAVIRTTDGRTWQSHPNTPFTVPAVSAGCPAGKCVEHLRFANEEIGYAYGPDALFMTTNGAQSWTKLAGGADALETLDGNVIKVSDSVGGDCAAGCSYKVQTADLGSDSWTTAGLPGQRGNGHGVVLSRSGNRSLLEVFGNPYGNSASAHAMLWRSGDDGASWTNLGEPCPQFGGEIDSVDLTAAPDRSFTIACRPRDGAPNPFVIITSDGGRSFSRGGSIGGDPTAPKIAAPAASTVLAAGQRLHRSTDGGRDWHPVDVPLTGGASFIGFESSDVGRLLTHDGQQIWTTRDAGKTWTEVSF